MQVSQRDQSQSQSRPTDIPFVDQVNFTAYWDINQFQADTESDSQDIDEKASKLKHHYKAEIKLQSTQERSNQDSFTASERRELRARRRAITLNANLAGDILAMLEGNPPPVTTEAVGPRLNIESEVVNLSIQQTETEEVKDQDVVDEVQPRIPGPISACSSSFSTGSDYFYLEKELADVEAAEVKKSDPFYLEKELAEVYHGLPESISSAVQQQSTTAYTTVVENSGHTSTSLMSGNILAWEDMVEHDTPPGSPSFMRTMVDFNRRNRLGHFSVMYEGEMDFQSEWENYLPVKYRNPTDDEREALIDPQQTETPNILTIPSSPVPTLDKSTNQEAEGRRESDGSNSTTLVGSITSEGAQSEKEEEKGPPPFQQDLTKVPPNVGTLLPGTSGYIVPWQRIKVEPLTRSQMPLYTIASKRMPEPQHPEIPNSAYSDPEIRLRENIATHRLKVARVLIPYEQKMAGKARQKAIKEAEMEELMAQCEQRAIERELEAWPLIPEHTLPPGRLYQTIQKTFDCSWDTEEETRRAAAEDVNVNSEDEDYHGFMKRTACEAVARPTSPSRRTSKTSSTAASKASSSSARKGSTSSSNSKNINKPKDLCNCKRRPSVFVPDEPAGPDNGKFPIARSHRSGRTLAIGPGETECKIYTPPTKEPNKKDKGKGKAKRGSEDSKTPISSTNASAKTKQDGAMKESAVTTPDKDDLCSWEAGTSWKDSTDSTVLSVPLSLPDTGLRLPKKDYSADAILPVTEGGVKAPTAPMKQEEYEPQGRLALLADFRARHGWEEEVPIEISGVYVKKSPVEKKEEESRKGSKSSSSLQTQEGTIDSAHPTEPKGVEEVRKPLHIGPKRTELTIEEIEALAKMERENFLGWTDSNAFYQKGGQYPKLAMQRTNSGVSKNGSETSASAYSQSSGFGSDTGTKDKNSTGSTENAEGHVEETPSSSSKPCDRRPRKMKNILDDDYDLRSRVDTDLGPVEVKRKSADSLPHAVCMGTEAVIARPRKEVRILGTDCFLTTLEAKGEARMRGEAVTGIEEVVDVGEPEWMKKERETSEKSKFRNPFSLKKSTKDPTQKDNYKLPSEEGAKTTSESSVKQSSSKGVLGSLVKDVKERLKRSVSQGNTGGSGNGSFKILQSADTFDGPAANYLVDITMAGGFIAGPRFSTLPIGLPPVTAETEGRKVAVVKPQYDAMAVAVAKASGLRRMFSVENQRNSGRQTLAEVKAKSIENQQKHEVSPRAYEPAKPEAPIKPSNSSTGTSSIRAASTTSGSSGAKKGPTSGGDSKLLKLLGVPPTTINTASFELKRTNTFGSAGLSQYSRDSFETNRRGSNDTIKALLNPSTSAVKAVGAASTPTIMKGGFRVQSQQAQLYRCSGSPWDNEREEYFRMQAECQAKKKQDELIQQRQYSTNSDNLPVVEPLFSSSKYTLRNPNSEKILPAIYPNREGNYGSTRATEPGNSQNRPSTPRATTHPITPKRRGAAIPAPLYPPPTGPLPQIPRSHGWVENITPNIQKREQPETPSASANVFTTPVKQNRQHENTVNDQKSGSPATPPDLQDMIRNPRRRPSKKDLERTVSSAMKRNGTLRRIPENNDLFSTQPNFVAGNGGSSSMTDNVVKAKKANLAANFNGAPAEAVRAADSTTRVETTISNPFEDPANLVQGEGSFNDINEVKELAPLSNAAKAQAVRLNNMGAGSYNTAFDGLYVHNPHQDPEIQERMEIQRVMELKKVREAREAAEEEEIRGRQRTAATLTEAGRRDPSPKCLTELYEETREFEGEQSRDPSATFTIREPVRNRDESEKRNSDEMMAIVEDMLARLGEAPEVMSVDDGLEKSKGKGRAEVLRADSPTLGTFDPYH